MHGHISGRARACNQVAAGPSWRVVKRDGIGIPVRTDRRPNRLSVEITKGIVTAATVG